jgi:hypothetical protein
MTDLDPVSSLSGLSRQSIKIKALFPDRTEIASFGRHCEPTGRANARPMTGSAKQSMVRHNG